MSDRDKTWLSWLQQTLYDKGDAAREYQLPYVRIAERVLGQARIQPGDAVLDIGTGTGLLAFNAAQYISEMGKVVGIDTERACIEACRLEAECKGERRASFIEGDALALPFNDNAFDVVVMRSTLCHISRKRDVIRQIYRVLKPGGRISLYEPVDRHSTRHYQLVDLTALDDLGGKAKMAEERIYRNKRDALLNFDEVSLAAMFRNAGFHDMSYDLVHRSSQYSMTYALARQWWEEDIGSTRIPGRPSPRELLARNLTEKDINTYIDFFCAQLDGKTITFDSAVVYLWGSKGDETQRDHKRQTRIA